MPRTSSTVIKRQWKIGLALQRQPWTIAELAKAFRVTKSTAQRDVDILRELFIITRTTDQDHSQRVRYCMPGKFIARRLPR